MTEFVQMLIRLSTYHLLSADIDSSPYLNTFRDILLTRLYSDFFKGHNYRKGDNSDKTKVRVSNFAMRNSYNYEISKP